MAEARIIQQWAATTLPAAGRQWRCARCAQVVATRREETGASARGHRPSTWSAVWRLGGVRQRAHRRGGLWPFSGGERGSGSVKDRPVAWGGGAVKCGDRLPTWRVFGDGRGGRHSRGAGGGVVAPSSVPDPAGPSPWRLGARRLSGARQPLDVSRRALLPGRPALDARPPANNPPAEAACPPRGSQCQSASERAGWRGSAALPATHRPFEWVSQPRSPAHSSRVAVGRDNVGTGESLRRGAAALAGTPVACPRTWPVSLRLGGQRALSSRHTSSQALGQPLVKGERGKVHGRRGEEAGAGSFVSNGGCDHGPKSLTARIDRPRFQWWRPARSTYSELSLAIHSGRSPHRWGARSAGRSQIQGRKPRCSNPPAPVRLLLPAGGRPTRLRWPPSLHRQRDRGDTPPSGTRSDDRRPHCFRWRRRRSCRRHNYSCLPLLGTAGVVPPPLRFGREIPTSRGTDGLRTVRHAAARGGP